MSVQALTKSLPIGDQGAKMERSIFLNVGCGTADDTRLPLFLREPAWHQVRLDIDPEVKPDIVSSITDMHMVRSESVDLVFSSHNLEHLEWYQVQAALKEFRRVLKPQGLLLITLPDLERIADAIIKGRLLEPAYVSPAGSITPLDMLYGHRDSIQKGCGYMAHRCGFTGESLGRTLMESGFAEARLRKGKSYDLWAVAGKKKLMDDQLAQMREFSFG